LPARARPPQFLGVAGGLVWVPATAPLRVETITTIAIIEKIDKKEKGTAA